MPTAPFAEPFDRFRALFDEAAKIQPQDPNQVWLGTVDGQGRPSVRVVLLKSFDPQGFVFFTNYESRKGRALDATREAALCFYWQALGQQVRVEGPAARVSEAESDAYFASRPRLSQLGAWASEQSSRIGSRLELEAKVAALTVKYLGRDVPRPPHWGGFRLEPRRIEFWKAHPFRLHWREEYLRQGDAWDVGTLAP